MEYVPERLFYVYKKLESANGATFFIPKIHYSQR